MYYEGNVIMSGVVTEPKKSTNGKRQDTQALPREDEGRLTGIQTLSHTKTRLTIYRRIFGQNSCCIDFKSYTSFS
jgi:hypothetical protein